MSGKSCQEQSSNPRPGFGKGLFAGDCIPAVDGHIGVRISGVGACRGPRDRLILSDPAREYCIETALDLALSSKY